MSPKKRPQRRIEMLPVVGGGVCRRSLSDGLIVSTLMLEVAPAPSSAAADWLRRCFSGQAQVGRIIVDGDETADPPRMTFRFEPKWPPLITFELRLPVTDARLARQAIAALVNTRILLLTVAPATIAPDGILRGPAMEITVPAHELQRFAEALQ
jgi:hypothetical protein